MKKITFLFLFAAVASISYGQKSAAVPVLNNNHPIPAFTVFAAPDSTAFTNRQLKKDKPVVLMFFSPDCEHCQKETKELLAYKQELKGLQIVMVSPAAYSLIKDFYKDYNIASMPGITMGHDPNHSLSMKYQLRTYPCAFVYDATGKMVKEFVGNVSVPSILDAVNTVR